MKENAFRFICAIMLGALTGCAAVTDIESKKQPDYELPASELLVLYYFSTMQGADDFSGELIKRLNACGAKPDFMPVMIFGHDIDISRNVEKPFIQKRLGQSSVQTILEIVPAREFYVNYGTVLASSNYMVSLQNVNGDKLWNGKFTVHQPNIFSYAFMPNSYKAFADALVDKMASDGVLTHCPVQNQ